jgi:hypothetical protein
MSQISEIIAHYGLSPKIYLRASFSGDFQRVLYEYIESGIPVVIGLEKPDHAVIAIGHVSDFTLKPKEPGIIWSSSYVNGLVVNDDNSMPYQIIPLVKDSIAGHVSEYFTLDQIDSFVVPLHDKIHLVAEDVEGLTFRVLQDPIYGLEPLSPILNAYEKSGELVIRQFLTTSRAYREVRSKAEAKLPNSIERFYSTHPMPKFIWVTELSMKSLFEDKQQILGEILWDATASQRDRYAFLLIHYPEILLVNDRDSISDDLGRFDVHILQHSQPYTAYRHNLQEVPNAHTT